MFDTKSLWADNQHPKFISLFTAHATQCHANVIVYGAEYCEKCYHLLLQWVAQRWNLFSRRIAFSCGNHVGRTIWHSKLINFGERAYFSLAKLFVPRWHNFGVVHVYNVKFILSLHFAVYRIQDLKIDIKYWEVKRIKTVGLLQSFYLVTYLRQ